MFRIAKRKLFVFILLALCQCSLCYEAPANERPSPESSLAIDDEAMKFVRQWYYNAHRRDYSHISMNFYTLTGGIRSDRDIYIKIVEKFQYWIPEIYANVIYDPNDIKGEILCSDTFRINFLSSGEKWEIKVDNNGKYLLMSLMAP